MAENGLTFERVGRNPRLSDTITEKLLDAIVVGRFKACDLFPSEREAVGRAVGTAGSGDGVAHAPIRSPRCASASEGPARRWRSCS